MIVDVKNGLLPMFRHAPSLVAPFPQGLKGLLCMDSNPLNQVQLAENSKKLKKIMSAKTALNFLPISIFGSRSQAIPADRDDDMPM